MARKKRLKEEDEEITSPKRAKPIPAVRRSTRKSAPKEELAAEEEVSRTRQRGSKAKVEETKVLSDSSSLSDLSSEVFTPSPPKFSTARRKSASSRQATAKEHEDALNLFARDDSEVDDLSDSSATENTPQKRALDHSLEDPETTGDEEEEDWEEVDLSHQKQLSLEDLNKTQEAPNLEITLERNQQSMRIKLSHLHASNAGTSRLVLQNGRFECIPTFFIFYVSLSMEEGEMHGSMTKNYMYVLTNAVDIENPSLSVLRSSKAVEEISKINSR